MNMFPRHVVPDELSLLSVYEIIAYLLVLLGCVFLYHKWHKIQVVHQEIHVERLDSIHVTHLRSAVTIDYEAAISSVIGSDMSSIRIHAARPIQPHSSMYIWSYTDELDSLLRIYKSHYPKSLEAPSEVITYVKQTLYKKERSKGVEDEELLCDSTTHKSFYQYAHYGVHSQKPYYLWNESFLNYLFSPGFDSSINTDISSLTTPGYFSLRDISQAYYAFHIVSHSVDSIYLRVSNIGAAEFTPSGMVDATIKGGHIEYALSLLSKENTVMLHVKFKDLENDQSRRVFLVCAVISGLITLFLAFLIILIYRVISGIRMSKKKAKDISDGDALEEPFPQG